MKIGFIGNFKPPFSTENDRKWSFEKLGHEVIPFQENETTADMLMAALMKVDLLLYSHTHDPSYVIKDLVRVFEMYKKAGIPTASVHLDRWAGLAREKDLGREATWFTEYQFMADGSLEAVRLYEKYGLNWYWLKPGVIERDCYMAIPDKQKYPHDIVFTGSKGYHPEYPYRQHLIEWLKKTYGPRFAHYGNDGIRVMRGRDLNDLYASSKIVVGDSCFGGRPRYVSDRYFEVRGRGGFLIHPKVEGFDTEGVVHYDHSDFDDLARVIDHYLANPAEVEKMRWRGFDHVRTKENYTVRAQEILRVIHG